MKKFLSFALSAALTLSLAAFTASAEPIRSPYALQGDHLSISGLPKDGTVSVTVNGQAIAEIERSTAQAENTPILYFCIVDPSTSMSNMQHKQQRDVLTGISRNMRDCDRMVLAMMSADTLNVGEMLETPEDRKRAIQDTWQPSWSTRLFEDVQAAMQAITAPEYADYLTCAVLTTDGINEGASVLPAAQEAIRNSGIRFHSVALLSPSPDGYAKNNAARALALAENSFDCVARNPLLEKVEAIDVGKQIAETMLNSVVLQLDTSEMDRDLPLQTIALTVQAGEETLETSFDIPTAYLPKLPEPEPEPEPEPTIPETTEPETVVPETTLPEITVPSTEPEAPAPTLPADSRKAPPLLLIIGSAVGLLVVVLVLVFFLYKHKAEEEQIDKILSKEHPLKERPLKEHTPKEQIAKAAVPENKESRSDEEAETLNLLAWAEALGVKDTEFTDSLVALDFHKPDIASAENAPQIAAFQSPASPAAAEPQSSSAPKTSANPEKLPSSPFPGCYVKLTPTVDLDWTTEYFLPVNEPKTFGRSHQADFQLNETDPGLSDIHFEMLWDGRALFLRDKYSTNGVALNKVPPMPDKWIRVQKNAILLAGSYEYKIVIAK